MLNSGARLTRISFSPISRTDLSVEMRDTSMKLMNGRERETRMLPTSATRRSAVAGTKSLLTMLESVLCVASWGEEKLSRIKEWTSASKEIEAGSEGLYIGDPESTVVVRCLRSHEKKNGFWAPGSCGDRGRTMR